MRMIKGLFLEVLIVILVGIFLIFSIDKINKHFGLTPVHHLRRGVLVDLPKEEQTISNVKHKVN